jgi:hypothetical protein
MKIGNWSDEPCFYASCVDGGRMALLLGPFRNEEDCRKWSYYDVESGGDRWRHGALCRAAEAFDARAVFYAFGMVRMKDGSHIGKLNDQLRLDGLWTGYDFEPGYAGACATVS